MDIRNFAQAALILVALGSAGSAMAQHDAHEHHAAAAGLGDIDFPVSCTPVAQAKFNTAVALLHSFYWERIDAAVDDVLAADPDCAMAHWVRAVGSLENALGSPPSPQLEAKGWDAVQQALAIGGRTPRERDYIAAVEAVFKDHANVPFPVRAKAFEAALAKIHRTYPDDVEAAIFYALWLQVTADRNDQTYAQQLESARLLEQVLPQRPDHPGIAHYLIHAYDFPAIANRGLDAANRYAKIAPDSPHALHMPSHIFSRVGQWQASIDTNLRSHAAAHSDRDKYHALDYLVYAQLQLALDDDAKKWVDFVNTAPNPGDAARQIAYASAAIPARYALERGDWAAAAKLELHPARDQFDWAASPEGEAVNAYARGLGAARSGEAAAARVEVTRLAALRATMVEQKKPYWAEQADIQSGAITAWIARAEGRDENALRLMRETADAEDKTEEHIMMPGRVIPVREMLGELLLDLKRPAEALAAFERSLVNDPNRFRNMYGAAHAAELAGDHVKSSTYYGKLLEQVRAATGRSEIERARAFSATR